MAAPPPQKTGSAHQDVMQFLQDLDSLNLQPSDKASSPAPNSKSVDDTPAASAQSTQDVLSFLDELTAAPTKPTSPKTPTTSSRQPSKPDSLPSASHLFGDASLKPLSEARPAAPQVPATSPPSQQGDSWSWNSLWSQAQATASNITAATGASLSLAQHIVEDAAKVVTSEKVKGLVANVSTNLTDSVHNVVNNNRVQSLSNDISKFTISSVSTISDILAPPISPNAARAFVRRRSVQGLFARTITVWMCALTADPAGPTDLGPTHDQVHDFVQATGNALWITDRPEQGICSKLVVNGVANPDPQSAKGFNEAIEIVENTLQKLTKFADQKSLDPSQPLLTKLSNEENDRRVFLIIQPFVTLLSSNLFGAFPHIQFIIFLVSPSPTDANDVEIVSLVSQSVRADGGDGPLARWSKDQNSRVIETAITDAFEEFAVRCQLKEQEKHEKAKLEREKKVDA